MLGSVTRKCRVFWKNSRNRRNIQESTVWHVWYIYMYIYIYIKARSVDTLINVFVLILPQHVSAVHNHCHANFTLYSPCILSYIIAFIFTNTFTTPCRHIYPYICFDYLLVIIRGIKLYKHRLHILYNSSSRFNIECEPTVIVDV